MNAGKYVARANRGLSGVASGDVQHADEPLRAGIMMKRRAACQGRKALIVRAKQGIGYRSDVAIF